eukprot:scaffold12700_cov142-Skeletonema_menzelii.AAC.9
MEESMSLATNDDQRQQPQSLKAEVAAHGVYWREETNNNLNKRCTAYGCSCCVPPLPIYLLV